MKMLRLFCVQSSSMIDFCIDSGKIDHLIITDKLFVNEIQLKDAINIGVAKEKHLMKSYKMGTVWISLVTFKIMK